MNNPLEIISIQNRHSKQYKPSFDEKDPIQANQKLIQQQVRGFEKANELTRTQAILKSKLEQLQKLCKSLSNTNQQLVTKIMQLQEEFEQKQKQKSKEDEMTCKYTQLNEQQFTEVEQLIKQYRNSLQGFQQKIITNQKLHQEIKTLKQQIKILKNQKQSLQKSNNQLEGYNQHLILEVYNLENNNSRLQERSINTTSHYNINGYGTILEEMDKSHLQTYDEDLSEEMQVQLEGMINKLVKQLEHERILKKKLKNQVKRLSVELIKSEKQIKQKNQKIYEIEIKTLRKSKNSQSTPNIRYTDKLDVKIQSKMKEMNKPGNTRFQSFTLQELINGQFQELVTVDQRFLIGMKILDFFSRKIIKQDYSNVMPQNLFISNFNHKRPQLICVRKKGVSHNEQQSSKQSSLLWNIAFVLNNLFNLASDSNIFINLLDVTNKMMNNQESSTRQDLEKLKVLLNP